MIKGKKLLKYEQNLRVTLLELQYMIDRAYKSKRDGYQGIFQEDFNKLVRKSSVSTDGVDMWIADDEYEKRIKKYRLNNTCSESFYVYLATGLADENLYIGKGSGDRFKHCNSGVSSSILLNEYYFLNGKDSITVDIVKYFTNSDDALSFEEDLIVELKPTFNIKGMKW